MVKARTIWVNRYWYLASVSAMSASVFWSSDAWRSSKPITVSYVRVESPLPDRFRPTEASSPVGRVLLHLQYFGTSPATPRFHRRSRVLDVACFRHPARRTIASKCHPRPWIARSRQLPLGGLP